jgi:predicted  nucleic acid-binding Zn-ribbon protein
MIKSRNPLLFFDAILKEGTGMRTDKQKLKDRYVKIIKGLTTENTRLKKENEVLKSHISEFETLMEEYRKTINEVNKIKEKYNENLKSIQEIKAKYKKELKQTLSRIKKDTNKK